MPVAVKYFDNSEGEIGGAVTSVDIGDDSKLIRDGESPTVFVLICA